MADKHTDPLDIASEQEEWFRESSVRQAMMASRPEQTKDENGNWEHEECVDCGEDIPEGRLNLGKIRCIDCQELKEKRQRR